jgi:hypothetical protein
MSLYLCQDFVAVFEVVVLNTEQSVFRAFRQIRNLINKRSKQRADIFSVIVNNSPPFTQNLTF